jgi:MraZ protein
MLVGGNVNTLDDKGRVAFPTKLKSAFTGDKLFLTRGVERCLYAFPPPEWEAFTTKWSEANSNLLKVRQVQRHFLGLVAEVDIDKSGRLAIPQSLRNYAGLKKNCMIMGLGDRIEIWDEDTYNAANGYADDQGDEKPVNIREAVESLADIMK